MKWLPFISIVLLHLSCSKPPSENSTPVDLCSVAFTSVDSLATFIVRNESNIAESLSTGENQVCVLGVVNKLATDPAPQRLQAIEVVAHYVDGSVGEYMMDRCVRLLESGDPHFTDYLIANRDGNLFKTVVPGVSFEMDLMNIPWKTEKEKLGANLTTDSQRKLLDEIFEQIKQP